MKTSNPKVTRGFTLIELLIVVAIIAILAAIAVPNFLEAQTRAKVTRARADMRSVATALEARAVDFKGGSGVQYSLMRMSTGSALFPARTPDDTVEPSGARGFNLATLPLDLTTPIAYLTTLFDDPFKTATAVRKNTSGGVIGPATVPADPTTRHYHYSNIQQLTLLPGFGFDDNDLREYGQWRLVSIGPDGEFFGSIGRRVYDPTNGTISLGDIIRTQVSSDGISRESTSGSN